MTISCFPRSEAQLRRIVTSLKEAGLFDLYDEQAHGEKILLSVHTRTFEEQDLVREIFKDAGILQLFYDEGSAA